MTKINTVLTVILLMALAAVPVMFIVGMNQFKAEQTTQLSKALEEMKAENEQLFRDYEKALQDGLSAQASEWDQQHATFRSNVREALLNSGVTLEQMDAAPVPPAPDLTISQEVYNSLEKGQTYEEIVVALGREGENILNIEDGEGRTSAYEWRWDDENGKAQTLSATFINGKMNHKTYSAFVF
jgi:hypothetical protein